MNRVKYTGYVTGKAPLSTEGLDFIQEQIFLAAEYAKAAGGNFILSGCRQNGDSISAGTVIIEGEILPFTPGVVQPFVRIVEVRKNITADGFVYVDMMTQRRVEFSAGAEDNSYEWDSFSPFPTNQYLNKTKATREELETLQKLAMPKGAIIMWNGIAVPEGFHLCDGSNVPNYGAVPDLRGRFIVGLDPTKASMPVNASDLSENYGAAGNTGGHGAVSLTRAQMPAHDHVTDKAFNKFGARAADTPGGGGSVNAGSDVSGNINEYRISNMSGTSDGDLWTAATVKKEGEGQQHENRPPYYVLAFIIKVV